MPSTTSSHGSEDAHAGSRDDLCRRLAYRFSDESLLDLALRHRSWCSENGGVPSNERLEFLGDAILGLVVTDHLYRSAPDLSEGVLARHRSELVSAAALAEVARSVHLGAALSLGKGEEATGGRDKTSILADGMEAVLGACLPRRRHGCRHVGRAADARRPHRRRGARRTRERPQVEAPGVRRPAFRRAAAVRPERDRSRARQALLRRVELVGAPWGEGDGRTKKEAEQSAARTAVLRLQAEPIDAGSADGADSTNDTGDDPSTDEPPRRGTTPEPAGTTRGGNHA